MRRDMTSRRAIDAQEIIKINKNHTIKTQNSFFFLLFIAASALLWCYCVWRHSFLIPICINSCSGSALCEQTPFFSKLSLLTNEIVASIKPSRVSSELFCYMRACVLYTNHHYMRSKTPIICAQEIHGDTSYARVWSTCMYLCASVDSWWLVRELRSSGCAEYTVNSYSEI